VANSATPSPALLRFFLFHVCGKCIRSLKRAKIFGSLTCGYFLLAELIPGEFCDKFPFITLPWKQRTVSRRFLSPDLSVAFFAYLRGVTSFPTLFPLCPPRRRLAADLITLSPVLQSVVCVVNEEPRSISRLFPPLFRAAPF